MCIVRVHGGSDWLREPLVERSHTKYVTPRVLHHRTLDDYTRQKYLRSPPKWKAGEREITEGNSQRYVQVWPSLITMQLSMTDWTQISWASVSTAQARFQPSTQNSSREGIEYLSFHLPVNSVMPWLRMVLHCVQGENVSNIPSQPTKFFPMTSRIQMSPSQHLRIESPRLNITILWFQNVTLVGHMPLDPCSH